MVELCLSVCVCVPSKFIRWNFAHKAMVLECETFGEGTDGSALLNEIHPLIKEGKVHCIRSLESLILSRSFPVEFWESLMYNIISPICSSLISFSCLTALSSASSTILKKSGELRTALSCPRF